KTIPTLASGPSTSRPPTRTAPRLAGIRPEIIFSSVLLPHPDGPTSDTKLPSSISKETRSRARTPCAPLSNVLSTSSTAMSGATSLFLDELIGVHFVDGDFPADVEKFVGDFDRFVHDVGLHVAQPRLQRLRRKKYFLHSVFQLHAHELAVELGLLLEQNRERLVLMIAHVTEPFHRPLYVSANKVGPALDVVFLDDQRAAVDIEAVVLQIHALQLHALLRRGHLGDLVVRGAEHQNKIDFLCDERRGLQRRRGLLNFDRFVIDVVDPAKSRHEIPLRLAGADRERFALEVFESFDRRVVAPEDRGRNVTELGNRLDLAAARARDDRRRQVGIAEIGQPGRDRLYSVCRSGAGLDVNI